MPLPPLPLQPLLLASYLGEDPKFEDERFMLDAGQLIKSLMSQVHTGANEDQVRAGLFRLLLHLLPSLRHDPLPAPHGFQLHQGFSLGRLKRGDGAYLEQTVFRAIDADRKGAASRAANSPDLPHPAIPKNSAAGLKYADLCLVAYTFIGTSSVPQEAYSMPSSSTSTVRPKGHKSAFALLPIQVKPDRSLVHLKSAIGKGVLYGRQVFDLSGTRFSIAACGLSFLRLCHLGERHVAIEVSDEFRAYDTAYYNFIFGGTMDMRKLLKSSKLPTIFSHHLHIQRTQLQPDGTTRAHWPSMDPLKALVAPFLAELGRFRDLPVSSLLGHVPSLVPDPVALPRAVAGLSRNVNKNKNSLSLQEDQDLHAAYHAADPSAYTEDWWDAEMAECFTSEELRELGDYNVTLVGTTTMNEILRRALSTT